MKHRWTHSAGVATTLALAAVIALPEPSWASTAL
jgi:hypothetical protein